MRTLATERELLYQCFRGAVSGKRRYEVSGSIAFEFMPYATGIDPGALANEILEVDKLFPWRAGPGSESITYLSEGETITQNHTNVSSKVCWFHLHPRPKLIEKGQVYAYEKYLAKLAQELAKRFFGVSEVRSVLEVHAVSWFKA